MKRQAANTVQNDPNQVLDLLSQGGIITYPTDTVYGVGCNATNKDAVKQVREAKQRPDKPMSVIAPSQEWIHEHFYVNEATKDAVDDLPGPYTYILSVTEPAVADNVAPGQDSLGIRRPDHWITSLVEDLDKPLVTTSANISGQSTAKTIEELPKAFTEHVNTAIDEGRLDGSASTIIDYTDDEPERIR